MPSVCQITLCQGDDRDTFDAHDANQPRPISHPIHHPLGWTLVEANLSRRMCDTPRVQ
jgi:hypothetical protein